MAEPMVISTTGDRGPNASVGVGPITAWPKSDGESGPHVGPIAFWPNTNGSGDNHQPNGNGSDNIPAEGNQVFGIPISLPVAGRSLNDIIFPSNEYFANYAAPLRFNDARMPLLPPGQPITLNALCPLPGSDLPELTYSDPPPDDKSDSAEHKLPQSILPLSTIVDFKWNIQVKDFNASTDMSKFDFDKLTPTNPDGQAFPQVDVLAQVGKEFQIIAGSIYAPQLTILLPPSASYHAVQISLSVSVWWPTKTRTTFPVPMSQAVPQKKGSPFQKWVPPALVPLQCVMDTIPSKLLPLPMPSDDLYSKFQSLCAISSPEMKVYPAPSGSLATDISVLPIGKAVSLYAIIPPLDLEVPLKGLNLVDGSKLTTPGGLPLGTTVELKWHIQTADFDPDGSPNFTSDSRPALTQSDLGGRFELLSGSLIDSSLSFLPWPEASVTSVLDTQKNFLGNAPSKKFRAYQIKLEVKLSSPSRPSTTFFLPPGGSSLRCAVDSWAHAFNAGADGLASLPKGPSDLKPGSIAPGEGLVDPTAFFRDMFTMSIDDLAPDYGQAATLLVSPTDKSKAVSNQIKEISDQRPNTKFTAAIDIGASIENVAKSIIGALGFSPAKDKGAAGVLTVVNVLSKLFSIPIALDIDGTNVTKILQPKTGSSGPLPNLDSVGACPTSALPDGSALSGVFGSVPVGGITTMVAATAKDLRVIPDAASGTSRVLANPLPNGLGLSLLPVPVFGPVTDPAAPAPPVKEGLAIKLRVNISTPGSNTPVTMDLDLGKIFMMIPRLPIPQITMMTRHGPTALTSTADAADTLIVLDPDTAAVCPNLDFVRISLSQTSTIIKKLLGVFSPQGLAKVGGSKLFASWADLGSTLELMANRINDVLALKPYDSIIMPPLAAANVLGHQYYSLDLKKQSVNGQVFYKWTPDQEEYNGYAPTNVSSVYWVGCPSSKWKLKVNIDGLDANGFSARRALNFPSCYPIKENSAFNEQGGPYTIYSAAVIQGGYAAPVEQHSFNGSVQTWGRVNSADAPEPWGDRLTSLEFNDY